MRFISTKIGIVLLALSEAVFATTTDIRCNIESAKVVRDNCSAKDNTGLIKKAKAFCSVNISAPKGYFFLKNEIVLSVDGTTYGALSRTSFTTHEIAKNTEQFKSIVIQTASATSKCSRSPGTRLGKSCHAKIAAAAIAYPNECLKGILLRSITKLL